jgi:hypothetical protein
MAFCGEWRTQFVVTAFTRFHPIFANHRWLQRAGGNDTDLAGAAGLVGQGQTVAIDLTKTEQETWSLYRRPLRQSITRTIRAGVLIEHDPEWRYINEFIRLYYATMTRNRAAQFYHFTPDFFFNLKTVIGESASLMVGIHLDRVIAAALLFECGGIVNIFLLGTDAEYNSLSPAKLLFHQAQLWARSRGNRYLHLGGGRGSRDHDELFRFKCLFSPTVFPFYTGRWILDVSAYRELMHEVQQEGMVCGGESTPGDDFFPAYRSPRGTDVIKLSTC